MYGRRGYCPPPRGYCPPPRRGYAYNMGYGGGMPRSNVRCCCFPFCCWDQMKWFFEKLTFGLFAFC